MSFILVIPVITGLLIGWLVNYLADVLPLTLKLSHPVCSNADCGQPFQWLDYLLLRPCRNCGRRRTWRTYLVPLILLSIMVYLWIYPPRMIGFVGGMIILAYLSVVAIIDLEHRLVLRPLSIVGLVIGALSGWLMNGWLNTLIGGAAGFGIMFIFYLFGLLFSRLRARRLGLKLNDSEEALGSGDVTLATILGLLLGWPLIWFGLLLGILLAGVVSLLILVGLLVSKRYGKKALMVFIPYGPAFILSTILLVYFPRWMAYLVHK